MQQLTCKRKVIIAQSRIFQLLLPWQNSCSIKADEKCVSKAKQGRERTQEHNKRYNKEFSKSFQLAGLLYTAKRETKLRLRLAELSGFLLELAKKYNARTRIDLLWKIFSKLFNLKSRQFFIITFNTKLYIYERVCASEQSVHVSKVNLRFTMPGQRSTKTTISSHLPTTHKS
uniref:Uncharacterized protein n=1 Tax=Trichogramma kaykai TaxID=54128 RepID=A0ABD2W3L5_9HYME